MAKAKDDIEEFRRHARAEGEAHAELHISAANRHAAYVRQSYLRLVSEGRLGELTPLLRDASPGVRLKAAMYLQEEGIADDEVTSTLRSLGNDPSVASSLKINARLMLEWGAKGPFAD